MVKSSPVIGVVPARFASQRFPGKMLAPVLGIPLLQRTFQNVQRFRCLDALYVAVDDRRTHQLITDLGGVAIMTSPSCANGTVRIAQALEYLPISFPDDAIVINIQGDEPLLPESTCEQLIAALESDPSAVMATPVIPFSPYEDPRDPSLPKCVFDPQGNALYFSRSLIPYYRNTSSGTYYKHIGIYAFRKHFLMKYSEIPNTPLQIAEDLEQLKVLEMGYKIKAVTVTEDSIGVNEPKDLLNLERILCQSGSSLSQEASAPR